jgi:hypothetical protein
MKNKKNNKWLDEFDIPEAQNGIEGRTTGLTDIPFRYNGAWGGPSMQSGGSLPGSVGFTYARTNNPAPSEGPYAKKTLPSAQNGQEMKYYQEGLDWKPKNISRNGSLIPIAQSGTLIKAQLGRNVSESTQAPRLVDIKAIRDFQDRQEFLRKQQFVSSAKKEDNVQKQVNRVRKENYVASKPNTKLVGNNITTKNPERDFDGRAVSPQAKRFDKGLDHIMTGIETAGAITGVGSVGSNLLRLGAGALERKIGRNALSKAAKQFTSKVNPYINTLDEAAAYAQGDPIGIMGNHLNSKFYNPTVSLNTANNTLTGVEKNLKNSAVESSDLLLGENNLRNSFSTNLSDLKEAQKFAKEYGYELPKNLERISQSNILTDRTIRGMMNRHNTFVRGVSTNWEELSKRNPEILRHLEGKGFNLSTEEGSKQAAEYMATSVPIQTGYGRAGMSSDIFNNNLDGIYTSNSMNTAEGYTYGNGYIVKVKRPTNFSSTFRKDWINNNKLDYIKFNKLDDVQQEKFDDQFFDFMLSDEYQQKSNNLFNDKYKALEDQAELEKNWLKKQKYQIERNKELQEFAKRRTSEILGFDKQLGYNIDYKPGSLLKMADKKIPYTPGTTLRDNYDFIRNSNMSPSRKLNVERELIDIASNIRSNKGSTQDIIKAQQKYLEEKMNNKYAHYIHLGTPGEKILESLSSKRITPEIWKHKSRAHTNEYTKKLSALEKGGVIKDDRGQWAHPGEITEISSPHITMQNVPYPVLGIGADGEQILMQPGQDYKFKKAPVTEIPMAQEGKKIPPFVTSDINEFNRRNRAYQDSLNLYNSGEDYYNSLKKLSFDLPNIGVSEENLKKARNENYKKYPWDKLNMPVSNEKSGKKFQPVSKYNIYVSDIGNIVSNRYKKPVQKVIYQPQEKNKYSVAQIERQRNVLQGRPEIRDFRSSFPIQEDQYEVEFMNPYTNKVETRGFSNPKDADKFYNMWEGDKVRRGKFQNGGLIKAQFGCVGKNCRGKSWSPTLSDKSGGKSGGGMDSVDGAPVTADELKRSGYETMDKKKIKQYTKDLQTSFPGLSTDDVARAAGDSARIKAKLYNFAKTDELIGKYNESLQKGEGVNEAHKHVPFADYFYGFYRPMIQTDPSGNPIPPTVPQILSAHSSPEEYIKTIQKNYKNKKNGGWLDEL